MQQSLCSSGGLTSCFVIVSSRRLVLCSAVPCEPRRHKGACFPQYQSEGWTMEKPGNWNTVGCHQWKPKCCDLLPSHCLVFVVMVPYNVERPSRQEHCMTQLRLSRATRWFSLTWLTGAQNWLTACSRRRSQPELKWGRLSVLFCFAFSFFGQKNRKEFRYGRVHRTVFGQGHLCSEFVALHVCSLQRFWLCRKPFERIKPTQQATSVFIS